MSLTPIEEGDEPADGTPSGGTASGVFGGLRAALGTAVRRVVRALRGEPASSSSDSRETHYEGDREASDTAIRPAGQARLDGGRVSRQVPDRARESTGEASGPRIEAEESGERLRIHRPDQPEAYVSSDVYERIER